MREEARVTDWKARAEREAAAIIAAALPNALVSEYPTMVSLVAIGWLQGANYGSHETLALTEDAFDALRAAL